MFITLHIGVAVYVHLLLQREPQADSTDIGIKAGLALTTGRIQVGKKAAGRQRQTKPRDQAGRQMSG